MSLILKPEIESEIWIPSTWKVAIFLDAADWVLKYKDDSGAVYIITVTP